MNKKTLLNLLLIPLLYSGCKYDFNVKGADKISITKSQTLNDCKYMGNNGFTKGKIIEIDLYHSNNLKLKYDKISKFYNLSGIIEYKIQPNTMFGPKDAPDKYWKDRRVGELYFKCPKEIKYQSKE